MDGLLALTCYIHRIFGVLGRTKFLMLLQMTSSHLAFHKCELLVGLFLSLIVFVIQINFLIVNYAAACTTCAT